MKSSVPVSRIFTAAKRRNIPSEWFCPNSMNPLCSKSNERKRVRLTLRESPLTSESNNSIHPSGGPVQSSRHKTKIYDQKTFSYRSRPAAIHFLCLCPRQRLVGHQPSHQHGDELFRPSHETHLRHRCGRGTHRWGKSVLKIFVRRPGHLEDSRKLVWGVYFLDSRSHHFKKFLPLSLWRPIPSTRESVAR